MCSHPTAENLIAIPWQISRSEPKKFCHFFRALSQRQWPWTQVAPEKFSRACWERSIRLCLSSLLQQCGLSMLVMAYLTSLLVTLKQLSTRAVSVSSKSLQKWTSLISRSQLLSFLVSSFQMFSAPAGASFQAETRAWHRHPSTAPSESRGSPPCQIP